MRKDNPKIEPYPDKGKLTSVTGDGYKHLLNNIPVGIYRTAVDGEIIYANKGFLDIFNFKNIEELDNINITDLYVDKNYRLKAIESRLKNENFAEEFAAYTQDEKIIWVKNEGKAVRGEDNELLYFDGIIDDISQKKLADEKLRVSEIKLKELNSSKDKFFTIISHDLKVPFGHFITATELILDKINEFDTPQIENLIRLLNIEAEKSFKLLENLLEWSKSQRGVIKYKPEPFNLRVIVDGVINNLKQIAANKSILINTKIRNADFLYADKNMISTIVRNLISNAIKFTNEHGEVIVSTKFIANKQIPGDKILEVSVSDTGVGIREEDIPLLFDMGTTFTTKGTFKESGTGLGLILCKDFVEKHNGEIWVESIAGKGSKFKFTIP